MILRTDTVSPVFVSHTRVLRCCRNRRYAHNQTPLLVRSVVDQALKNVKTILDTTRNPRLAAEESHAYDDKFALAEFLTNTAVASHMNALERLGLESEQLRKVASWVHDDQKPVTLRFQAQDSCTFLKEQEVAIPSSSEFETTSTSTQSSPSSAGFFSGGTKTEKTSTRVIQKLKEYHWKVRVAYRIFLFCASDLDSSIELSSRETSTIIVTSGGQARPGGASVSSGRPLPPIRDTTAHAPVDVNMTWFFQMLSPKERICQFSIDRTSEKAVGTCKTPRRNDQVDQAVHFQKSFFDWAGATQNFFTQRVEDEIVGKHRPLVDAKDVDIPQPFPAGTRCVIHGLQKEPAFNGKVVVVIDYAVEQERYNVARESINSGLPPKLLIKPKNLKPEHNGSTRAALLADISTDGVFCPILPLTEDAKVLSMGDVGEFLDEQVRSLNEKTENLSKMFPPRQLVKLTSIAEATIVVMCQHIRDLSTLYGDGVDYIENMIKQQLVEAIGKEVQSEDFDLFMKFHNRKLYGPDYAPKPFTYAVRRPNRFPEGVLTIESMHDKHEPIETFARKIEGSASSPIHVPINAATSIEITGDRYLHGWMQHRFEVQPRNGYQLAARARQFSSFLVIVGTMAGPSQFDPKEAIILQNKDEVLIPLLTTVLPTAKEFKDAISSLSPEQKAFAQAYRSMQLESSVFGVCVIQLKAQLEKLLGLWDGALTKEIQLTQDLMSLFVDYQIPSDLVSFDGPSDKDQDFKLLAVKKHVKSVKDVVIAEKEKQIAEEARKADMRAEMNFTGETEQIENGMDLHYGDEGTRMLRSTEVSYPMASMASCASASRAPEALKKTRSKGVYATSKRTNASLPSRAPTPSIPLSTEPVQPGMTSLAPSNTSVTEDFTVVPKLLDSKIEKYDNDDALRSTIIKAGAVWTRVRQENLLTFAKLSTLVGPVVEDERRKAFDLLDAISRSGTLPIDCAELHIIVGVAHCFENDCMGTIIQDNVNPIEKVEKSSLMIAGTIFGESTKKLIADKTQLERVQNVFPQLLSS